MALELKPAPLTREAFQPFGDVITIDGAKVLSINEGTTDRFHDLCTVDVEEDGGRPLISVFRGRPRPTPIEIKMMERHPISSQAFVPLDRRPYLIVVADDRAQLTPVALRVFLASGEQGVNYRRGVWHYPLLSLETSSDFLVIDRGGPSDNLEEHWFDDNVGPIRVVV